MNVQFHPCQNIKSSEWVQSSAELITQFIYKQCAALTQAIKNDCNIDIHISPNITVQCFLDFRHWSPQLFDPVHFPVYLPSFSPSLWRKFISILVPHNEVTQIRIENVRFSMAFFAVYTNRQTMCHIRCKRWDLGKTYLLCERSFWGLESFYRRSYSFCTQAVLSSALWAVWDVMNCTVQSLTPDWLVSSLLSGWSLVSARVVVFDLKYFGNHGLPVPSKTAAFFKQWIDLSFSCGV